ncbi:MAG: hypothetical protein AABO41_18455 [Acidobacteriota bacterium]
MDPATVSKLAQLLDKSGHAYTKAADNVWTIKFKGKSLSEFQLFVTSGGGLIVIGTVVAEKGRFKATPEMALKLLRLTNDLDRVKIGLDKDGDLFVRIEASARVFDGVELKAAVEQVAAAADEVHAAIKPFLILSK